MSLSELPAHSRVVDWTRDPADDVVSAYMWLLSREEGRRVRALAAHTHSDARYSLTSFKAIVEELEVEVDRECFPDNCHLSSLSRPVH